MKHANVIFCCGVTYNFDKYSALCKMDKIIANCTCIILFIMKCVVRIMIIISMLTVNQNQKEPTQGHQIIKTFN